MLKKCTPLWREAHFQVKCTNYTMFGPLLKIEMSKKCTRLWREAHFQVKMYNVHHARTTFGSWHVGKVHTIVARSTFRSQKCKKLKGFGALLDVRMSFCVAGTGGSAPCQKRAKRIGFVSVSTTTAAALHSTPLGELHYTPLGSTTPHYTNYNYKYITLHYTTLITLHYATIHSAMPHYSTLTTTYYN